MTDKSIAWVDFTLLKYRQHGLNSIFLGPTVAQDKTGQILDWITDNLSSRDTLGFGSGMKKTAGPFTQQDIHVESNYLQKETEVCKLDNQKQPCNLLGFYTLEESF